MNRGTVIKGNLHGVAAAHREARFFLVMAWCMALMVVAGFAFNLAMGRSSFAVPFPYHFHAAVFFGWTALYVLQNTLVFRGNIALHRRLGKLALLFVPLIVLAGLWLTLTALRFRGGPPFFGQAEFLFVNICQLLAFAGLVGWAIGQCRHTDWHRRLMYGGMATLCSPGLARLLPLPFTIPHAFTVVFLAALVFPVIGMIADKRLHGRVHRAWLWTIALPLAALLLGEMIGDSEWALELTAEYVAGTPGGSRLPGPFLPPGL